MISRNHKTKKLIVTRTFYQIRTENNTRNCWVQVGIVSFGFGCAAKEKNFSYPGFYTDVSSIMTWIKNVSTMIKYHFNTKSCESISSSILSS